MKNKLREIAGKKIRWQYFNTVIILLFFGMFFAPYCILVFDLCVGNFNLSELLSDILISFELCITFALPFILLSILNRFFFGKIVCVMNEDGIHHKDGVTKWSEIERIEYEVEFPSRYYSPRRNWCRAIIYTKKTEITLMHAPMFILSEARKHSPGIDAKISKNSKWLIGLMITLFIILPFIIFFIK